MNKNKLKEICLKIGLKTDNLIIKLMLQFPLLLCITNVDNSQFDQS